MAFAVNVVAVTLFVTLTAMVVSLSVANLASVEVFYLLPPVLRAGQPQLVYLPG